LLPRHADASHRATRRLLSQASTRR
jgi:hypothetical protein